MLKREHLKQAIDKISLRAPEIGYSLDRLLEVGQIDLLPPERAMSKAGDFQFLFDGEILTVRRFIFINDPSLPIEQQLLIKFGEMKKKQEILEGGVESYFKAAEEITAAGLRFMVDYEIDLALERLGKNNPAHSGSAAKSKERCEAAGARDRVVQLLLRLKSEEGEGEGLPEKTGEDGSDEPIFRGSVGNDIPAIFLLFPYRRNAIEQVAGLNLEFFNVRFLLDTLVRGDEERLFACFVHGRPAGLLFLGLKERMFYRALEIRYIATHQGRLPGFGRSLRGVGSFLVAGAWMLWKTRLPRIRELVLDSEVGAIKFYQSIGFQQRHSFYFVLKAPKGYLLDSIINLAESCQELPSRLLQEIAGHIRTHIKELAKSRPAGEMPAFRKPTLRAIRYSILSKRHSQLARTAAESLMRYRDRIPEADELLRIGTEFYHRFQEKRHASERPVIIVHDLLFSDHLRGIFHMESPKRLQAVEAGLRNTSLEHKWVSIPPRAATDIELGWVHTRSHIDRIARTTGKEIVSLDLDTQTTEKSHEVARQAVGSTFNLIDEIWNGNSRRGFAFVRPPGHHAEADHAMGFCLFNNVALAARYLELVYGLERIMIVDIDAHHGNGTQNIFYNSRSVLYASFHQFPCFPGTGNLGEVGIGRGEGFTVNIPMARGSGDRDFTQAIHSIIRPIAEEYSPDALLVSCGFDLCQSDKLAKMNATPEGYALITFLLKEIADQVCDGKLIYILEGGYNLRSIEDCTVRVLQEMSDIPTLSRDRIERVRSTDPHSVHALKRVIEVQKKHWKSLR